MYLGSCTGYCLVYSLCMWRPAWVPLMSVIHIRDPCAEEEPEAVKGKESAAEHGG